MNEGLSAIDQNNVITFVNEQFCEMSGYSRDELIGYNYSVLLDKENQYIFKKQWSERLSGDATPYELSITKKDGKKIHTPVSPKPLFDGEGQFIGSFAILTDITDRKNSEEKLLSYQKQLRSLASELSLVEERQRRCIAAELNDYIGQTLYYCKNKLEVFNEMVSSTEFKTSRQVIALVVERIVVARSGNLRVGSLRVRTRQRFGHARLR